MNITRAIDMVNSLLAICAAFRNLTFGRVM